MEKGKYGVTLAFYGVIAFIFAIMGWSTALILLAGVVIVGEKNEWAGRQVIQAICLCFASSLVVLAINCLDFLDWIPFAGSVWYYITRTIYYLVDIAVLVFGIIAILKNAKGQEANVPLASKLANWAYGKVVVKPQPVYVQQPVAQAAPAPTAAPAPAPAAAPAPAPAPAAAPVATTCANCGAELTGGAFCTKCGTPVAK